MGCNASGVGSVRCRLMALPTSAESSFMMRPGSRRLDGRSGRASITTDHSSAEKPIGFCAFDAVEVRERGVGSMARGARSARARLAMGRSSLDREAGRKGACAPGHTRARRGEISERSEEHTSELQSLMRISYAVFCLKKKKKKT